jgi:hypothetical protein
VRPRRESCAGLQEFRQKRAEHFPPPKCKINPNFGNALDIGTFAGHLHIVPVIEPNIIAAASEPVIANRAKRVAILGAGGPDERRAKASVL